MQTLGGDYAENLVTMLRGMEACFLKNINKLENIT